MSLEGGDQVSDEALTPTLPATVASAHLSTCAAELAGNSVAGPYVSDLAELTTVVEDLVAGQQQIGLALARLADHLTARGRRGGLAQVHSPDLASLAEVLGAASIATGHAASALAESRPVLDIMMTSAGPDAQL